jgi:hypothetical protein
MSSDTEMLPLDQLAAKQIADPMLRFGGEDEIASVDPLVGQHVVGSDPIAAADLGLKNVDRVMPMLIPATSQLGGDYSRMTELYETLITHRHRQLLAVAKLVGGVEEVRYQAGRGTAPFRPVATERQRAAVQFLVNRAWSTPHALLDREVLMRITPSGGADALQGSNLELLRKLINPSVFERMAEAREMDPNPKGYTGIDMLYDLNDGLFSELDSSTPPVIELYRRNLQRNYVLLLLVAIGVESDPEGQSRAIDGNVAETAARRIRMQHLFDRRALSSALAETAQQYRSDGHPSEFRAALRLAIQDLYAKVNAAIDRAKHPGTVALLRELKAQLERA